MKILSESQTRTVFRISSFAVLLIVSSVLGFLGMPTEMSLSVVAGALGLAFSNIDKIARFKGAGFEAEMNLVHSFIENQTEPTLEQREEAEENSQLDYSENKILKSLQKPGYTWRYAKTVASEVNLPLPKVNEILRSLMARGFTKSGDGSRGQIWAATNLGKSIQEQFELKSQL